MIVILWRVVEEANLVLEIVISDKKAGKYVVLVHLCSEKMSNLCWFLIFMWIVVVIIQRLSINEVKTVTLTGETVQTKAFLSDVLRFEDRVLFFIYTRRCLITELVPFSIYLNRKL